MARQVLFVVTLLLSFKASAQFSEGYIEQLFNNLVYIETSKTQTYKEGDVEFEVYLRNPATNEAKPLFSRHTGTGFFIAKEIDIYLVTAAHVAVTTDLNTVIAIRSVNNFPLVIRLQDVIDKKSLNNNRLGWTIHPASDVAVLPLSIPPNLPDSMFYPTRYEGVFPKLEAPLRNTELTVYGFPLGLGVDISKSRISPFSKTYRAASDLIDVPRGDNQKLATFFLVDDPSVEGLSGGPVYVLPQYARPMNVTPLEVTGLFGLVHGSVPGKDSRYGAIVPSKFIAETIDMAPSYSGKYSYKYRNGKLWSEVVYKNGFPWDILSNFDKNGLPQDKGTLTNGSGTRNLYDENGKLSHVLHYINGRLVKTEEREEKN